MMIFKRENREHILRCYNIIYHNSYNFQESAKSFEQVLLRLDRLYFLFYNDSKIIPLLLTIDDKPQIEIFNNLKHITIEETDIPDIKYQYYTLLRYRKNIAIPFTDNIEPSPLYRVLADDRCLIMINAKYRQYNYHIASYLKKHEKSKDNIYYAYEHSIKDKLRAKHFLTRIIIASNNRDMIKSIALAFKDFKIGSITSNHNKLFDKPRYSFFHKDNVLSHIELLSLLLPDDIDNSRLIVDGVRPYTTSDML